MILKKMCRQWGVLIHSHWTLKPTSVATWLSSVLFYSDSSVIKKGKATPLQERRMIDRFRLWAKGGDGGNGCWSYQRSRKDRHGIPDGGNGGRGGDVYLECSSALWDFSNLQHHLNAKRGSNGISKNMIGTRGSDKVALVPVGTVIHLVSGELPTLVRHSSIASLDPWEIPISAEDSPSPTEEISQHKDDKANLPNILGVRDVSCSNYEIKESSSPSHVLSRDHLIGCKEVKREQYDRNEIEKQEDQWWEDDNVLWIDDNNEVANEAQFELADGLQHSVAELTEPGQRILIARGGDGGLGNATLSKDTKYRQFMKPKGASKSRTLEDDELFSLIAGKLGSETVLILEMKSIADIGLIGMPNAGKSTLLGAVSRAKPAVGHYAFTTLRPNLGSLHLDDFSVSVADIPGLIKGAHENRGLGHAFLRHIERTKVLVYVVDLAATLDGKSFMPWEQLRDLVLELEHYKVGLSKRPSLIVANKIDERGAIDVYGELKTRVHGVPIFPVCAVLGEGVPELKEGLRKLIQGNETECLELSNIVID
ncbi:hypothetical protein HPP92_013935 [Vanilla planifolia]|uniref:Uncharacterized protein n=1 Tax=Vanilla planifolia TaxID=51239 RepID=A0A835USN2_VANPL|nr:hypothetical protein HPP92_013935 [Vanilla planifolia]